MLIFNNPQFDCDRYSYTLQSLFNAIAIISSADLGFIDSHNLTLSRDGSSLHTHRFSSPEADIGWDSDLETFYFGFSLYNITYHNPNLGIDLPCFISIEKASRHDALTTISTSAVLFELNPELHPTFMCFDSASDNYVTHEFLASKHIIPIIDINCRRKDKNSYHSFEFLNDDGVPFCLNGNNMVYNIMAMKLKSIATNIAVLLLWEKSQIVQTKIIVVLLVIMGKFDISRVRMILNYLDLFLINLKNGRKYIKIELAQKE